MHPGVVAIPTALAMAEYVGGVSGARVHHRRGARHRLHLPLGLATRPGESIHQYGWHLTTLYGYMTAAFVAARLLGLDADGHDQRRRHRLSPVVGQRPVCQGRRAHQADGSRAWRYGAASPRPSWPSAASPARATAWRARPGSTRSTTWAPTRARSLIDELGTRFESINVSIKPYPCCRGVHPFIDAGLALAAKHDIRPRRRREHPHQLRRGHLRPAGLAARGQGAAAQSGRLPVQHRLGSGHGARPAPG